MIDKYGVICYRSSTSKCQKCSYFLNGYRCWNYEYIPYRTFENCIGYECKYYKSKISNQNNSHYIFRDYENKKLFPEKVFGGKYRFDKSGNRI